MEIKTNELVINRINDPRRWARCVQYFINQIDETQYGIEKLDLKLFCLFRET